MSKTSCAVIPGSFDPITVGHLDIIERASKMFDKVVVGLLSNSAKKTVLDESVRISMIKKACSHLPNIEVLAFNGLLVEFAKTVNANIIIRGLRSSADFEYEWIICAANRKLAPDIETMFIICNPAYSFVSSTLVKEIASYGGDISDLVPNGFKDDIISYCLAAKKGGRL